MMKLLPVALAKDRDEGRTPVCQNLHTAPPILEEVIAEFARNYGMADGGVDADGLMGETRNVALWLVWERCRLSQAGSGNCLGEWLRRPWRNGLRRLRPLSVGAIAINNEKY